MKLKLLLAILLVPLFAHTQSQHWFNAQRSGELVPVLPSVHIKHLTVAATDEQLVKEGNRLIKYRKTYDQLQSFISNHNGNVVVLYPSEKILLYSVGYDDDVAFVKIPFLPKPWNDKCYWVEVKDLDNEWYKFEGTK